MRKAVTALLAASMLAGMTSIPAFASTKEKIDSVDFSISYDLSSGMDKSDIDVDCSTDGVDSITVTAVTNTEYGKKPKATIRLKADSDYTFSGISKSNVKASGDECSITKTKASTSTLTVTVTLPKIGSTSDTALDISDVTWSDDDNGEVEWESADDADKYEVKLMRGSSSKETVTTTNTKYNFRSEIRQNGKGTYTVKVRAIAGTYKGDWTESDEWEIDSDELDSLGGAISSSSSSSGSTSGPGVNSSSSSGAWLRDSTGWWYCNADRSYTTNNWQQIDGNWYYFNQYGYMRTGWLQSPYSQKWYWLDPNNGRMITSSWVDNGKYYVDSNGVWNGQTK
jgi:glucan-binding YG repeat protein